jgi:hypothetical protein
LALALAWASPASAVSLFFDPDGAGPLAPVEIDSLDPSAGNGLSLGLTAASKIGDTTTFLFQANMAPANSVTTTSSPAVSAVRTTSPSLRASRKR